MHPRLLSDLADLERAASHYAAEQRRTRRRLRRAARTEPTPRRPRRRGPTIASRPLDSRPAR